MTRTTDSLSIEEARKLVLLSQRVPPKKQTGKALDATLSAIENLGYIQIDTISAIQRAHHHTLWSRNPKYLSSHLDDLMVEKKIFEYWSHAAAYLPMRDYRFSLPRKHAIKSGKDNHWYVRNEKLMKSILKRIDAEGPLMAKDFDTKGQKMGEWQTRPIKQALDNLYMQGELMIPYRVNFHKVYDLSERVLPDHTDRSMPGAEEHARFLITSYLRANGLGTAGEMSYLLKNTKGPVSSMLQEMLLSGEVLQFNAGGNLYYVLPASLELLDKPFARNKVKILSPFDNLLIQRKRILELFGFDYQLECYVPAPKRKFGYFVLPVLWDGKLVARMDCKADRKNSHMHIHKLVLESGLKKTDAFARALAKELQPFKQFNECSKLSIHLCSPPDFKPQLERFVVK
ncbi:MAG: crosslink repair DNA glycosylase YcaQ family protein [Bacteroides sp.]|nr:crosslink repair DNA glycosylase YcaQ family protein [Bacteroides sp.]